MKIKGLSWFTFALLAVVVGLYPAIYYFMDIHKHGLLQSKPKELLDTAIYIPAFFIHITFGGIAMLTGWTQFSQKLRDRYMAIHRFTGKVYIISVILSSLAGLYISFFSNGGIVSVSGFGILAIVWLVTVIKAYLTILKRDIEQHQNWMICNYALTFAAVTLRIYLPLAQFVIHADFITAYRIIAWLCWVPNLLVAGIIIRNKKQVILLEPSESHSRKVYKE